MKNQNENSTSRYGLLRVGEVCKVLALGRTKVFELIGDGSIPSVKIGASRRIRESGLRTYIDGLESSSMSHSQCTIVEEE